MTVDVSSVEVVNDLGLKQDQHIAYGVCPSFKLH